MSANYTSVHLLEGILRSVLKGMECSIIGEFTVHTSLKVGRFSTKNCIHFFQSFPVAKSYLVVPVRVLFVCSFNCNDL